MCVDLVLEKETYKARVVELNVFSSKELTLKQQREKDERIYFIFLKKIVTDHRKRLEEHLSEKR